MECSVKRCKQTVRSKGLCQTHYSRSLIYGDPTVCNRIASYEGIVCSVEGCDRRPISRGWCAKHYWRWQKYGNPDEPLKKNMNATGWITVQGYKKIKVGKEYFYEHRHLISKHLNRPLKSHENVHLSLIHI
jgi:hypothetical protein